MRDVGIRKPEIVRLSFRSRRNSFVHCPNFSSPARRKLSCRMNGDFSLRVGFVGSAAGKIRGAIVAVIIYDNREELARIVLLREGGDGTPDRFGLIACWNDRRDARPLFQRLELNDLFMDLPEISSGEEKIQPNCERDDGYKIRIQMHAILCNKSASRAIRDLPCESATGAGACRSQRRSHCRPRASPLAI